MSNWRRPKPRNNFHQQQRIQSSKPPLGDGKQSVPVWEKDFCAVVGSMPWWRVLEGKRFMNLYDRVLQWDDSAGEDAFKNAKSRFWAERNGLVCDLALPDPDAYIDDVDWDAEVDKELMLDLEHRGGPEVVRGEKEEPVVILDTLVLSSHLGGLGYGTGWGEAEGINEEQEVPWVNEPCDGWNNDSWGVNEKTETWDRPKNNNGFRNESWDQKKSYNNNGFRNKSWDRKPSYNNSFNQKKVDNWNGRNQEWRKRGEVPRREDRVEDCRWRNGRGRTRGGFQQHSNGWGWTETF